jgi:hypothetical protein
MWHSLPTEKLSTCDSFENHKQTKDTNAAHRVTHPGKRWMDQFSRPLRNFCAALIPDAFASINNLSTL